MAKAALTDHPTEPGFSYTYVEAYVNNQRCIKLHREASVKTSEALRIYNKLCKEIIDLANESAIPHQPEDEFSIEQYNSMIKINSELAVAVTKVNISMLVQIKAIRRKSKECHKAIAAKYLNTSTTWKQCVKYEQYINNQKTTKAIAHVKNVTAAKIEKLNTQVKYKLHDITDMLHTGVVILSDNLNFSTLGPNDEMISDAMKTVAVNTLFINKPKYNQFDCCNYTGEFAVLPDAQKTALINFLKTYRFVMGGKLVLVYADHKCETIDADKVKQFLINNIADLDELNTIRYVVVT